MVECGSEVPRKTELCKKEANTLGHGFCGELRGGCYILCWRVPLEKER